MWSDLHASFSRRISQSPLPRRVLCPRDRVPVSTSRWASVRTRPDKSPDCVLHTRPCGDGILGGSWLERVAPGFLSVCLRPNSITNDASQVRGTGTTTECDSTKDSIGSTSRSMGSSEKFSSRRRLGACFIATKVVAQSAVIRDRSLIGFSRAAGDARGELAAANGNLSAWQTQVEIIGDEHWTAEDGSLVKLFGVPIPAPEEKKREVEEEGQWQSSPINHELLPEYRTLFNHGGCSTSRACGHPFSSRPWERHSTYLPS
jgi:hypothetical protein